MGVPVPVSSHIARIEAANATAMKAVAEPHMINASAELARDRVAKFLSGQTPVETLAQLESRVDLGGSCKLGEGTVSEVILARDRLSGKPVAVKIISLKRTR